MSPLVMTLVGIAALAIPPACAAPHDGAAEARPSASEIVVASVTQASRGNPTSGSQSTPTADHHGREIVDQDGRTLLWANDMPEGETDWFDLTDADIDPETFQFGIGRDTIPSIDAPIFVAASDPLLAERGVDAETQVLGVELDGVTRAYPVDVMSMHEIVNDEFGGKPYAVLW